MGRTQKGRRTMNMLTLAANGMTEATRRLDDAATRVSAAAKPGSDVDEASATVEEMEAKLQFEASVRVAQVADETSGRLLDLKV